MKKSRVILCAMIWVFSLLLIVPSVHAEGNDEYTKLLVQSETFNNSNIFEDSSSEQHVIAANGAYHSTNQAKFGGSSIFFTGNGSSYLRIGNNTDFNFGSSDFTIDFWSYLNTNAVHRIFCLGYNFLHYAPSSNNAHLIWYHHIGGYTTLDWVPGIQQGEWFHVAIVCRPGNDIRVYEKGQLVAEAPFPYAFYNNGTGNWIGQLNWTPSTPLNGYIEEFRISNTARWTDNFTTPTEPYSEACLPPIANFSASPLYGVAPLVVNFTDESVGCITDWAWFFGDGSQSNDQNPIHVYYNPGTYDVQLNVVGEKGQDQVSKSDYITVVSATAPEISGSCQSFSCAKYGETISLDFTVENSGLDETGKFQVALYGSNDGVTRGDLLDKAVVKSLAGGQSAKVKLTYKSKVSNVFTHVIAIFDSENEVLELSELNNSQSILVPCSYNEPLEMGVSATSGVSSFLR